MEEEEERTTKREEEERRTKEARRKGGRNRTVGGRRGIIHVEEYEWNESSDPNKRKSRAPIDVRATYYARCKSGKPPIDNPIKHQSRTSIDPESLSAICQAGVGVHALKK